MATPLRYRHIATIRARLEFPLDLLRSERCVPFAEADSRAIARSIRHEPETSYLVQVVRVTSNDASPFDAKMWAVRDCELVSVTAQPVHSWEQF